MLYLPLSFKRIGDNMPDFKGKKVVVIGGGNVAMDCARTQPFVQNL